MSSVDHFQLGPTLLELRGDVRVATKIKNELKDAAVTIPERPADLSLEIGNEPVPFGPATASHSGRRFPYSYETVLRERGVTFSFAGRFGRPLYTINLAGSPLAPGPQRGHLGVALADVGLLTRVLSPLTRALTRDFSTPTDIVAKNLLYEAVDPLVWCSLLTQDASFVHAGAVATPDGQGVLLMGTGGVGKTTTVLDLVLSGRWRYLGDDLVIVSPDGLNRHPKHLQLYAYNSVLVPGVQERILRGRTRTDRFLWNARLRSLGPRQVRRRTAASTFFGRDAVAEAADLTAAVKLTTALGTSGIEVTDADPARLARQAASVICDEFWDFTRFLNSVATLTSEAPTLGELQARVAATIERALPTEGCYEVGVPPGTPGAEISAALNSRLPLD